MSSSNKSPVGFLPGEPWWRRVAAVLLLPLIIPTIPLVLAVFLVFGVICLVYNGKRAWLFYRQMHLAGRVLPRRTLDARIAAEGGTLIQESDGDNGVSLVWWTPDDVVGRMKYSPTTDEEYYQAFGKEFPKWDEYCWREYTHADSGSAYLVAVWTVHGTPQKLTRRFPSLNVVRAWTGLRFHVSPPLIDPPIDPPVRLQS